MCGPYELSRVRVGDLNPTNPGTAVPHLGRTRRRRANAADSRRGTPRDQEGANNNDRSKGRLMMRTVSFAWATHPAQDATPTHSVMPDASGDNGTYRAPS